MTSLYKDFYQQEHDNKTITKIEKDILTIIRQNPSEDYTKVLEKEDRWEVYSQLAPMRTALFQWYEFKKDASLLEIEGGFGALTGIFCDKCQEVITTESSEFLAEAIQLRYKSRDNLKIYEGRVEEMDFNRKFDYIILSGTLEKINGQYGSHEGYIQFLKKITLLLNTEGTILIAVDNRYGIRYFCGEEEEYTRKPFAGTNHQQKKGYSYHRQELIELLKSAGVHQYKFYYPLPDYKLPQVIYSQDYLPEGSLYDKMISFNKNKMTLIARENDLYPDLTDNHVFEFFANSFLVECSETQNFCEVIYSEVDMDSGKESAYITILKKNNVIVQKALSNSGEDRIRRIHTNLEEMAKSGIKVVSHTYQEEQLSMPFLQKEKLSDYLGKIIRKNQIEFIKILDQFYDRIVSSSVHSSGEENRLKKYRNPEGGVILQRAYLDMLPTKCFYINKEFVFFDQIETEDNYPANYIFYCALKELYMSYPDINRIVSRNTLLVKYSLMEYEVIFDEEEKQRIKNQQKYGVYQQFKERTEIDSIQINRNINRLLYEAHTNNPEINEKMAQIRKVQMNLYKEFQKLCDSNDLNYYLAKDTILLDVKQESISSWNKNLKLAMPRTDYEKFKILAGSAWKEPYFLQTNESEAKYFGGGVSRLRNSSTTGMGYSEMEHDYNQGIEITILVLDSLSKDKKQTSKQLKQIRFYQELLLVKVYGGNTREQDYTSFEVRHPVWYRFLNKFTEKSKLLHKFDQACTCMKEGEVGEMVCFTRYSYITLSKECSQLKQASILSTEIPYTRFTRTFRNIGNKQIILFGSGAMFEHYMKYHGEKHRPAFLVDNNSETWGMQKQGIPIIAPEMLLTMDKDKIHLILCNVYFHEIGEQLEKMGIDEYYIYIQKKEWL
ncbi:MAG: LicD family protein [Mobilitalea sp.]